MRVIFHVTMPPSSMAACDAVIQEVEAIRQQVSGEIYHLYPTRMPGTRFPRRFWGLQRLAWLRRVERVSDLHHIFNPDPYPFAIQVLLHRPVIYTVVAGVRTASRDVTSRLAAQVRALVVPTQKDLDQLHDWDIRNAVLIPPGIDVDRFTHIPLPLYKPLTLLMGSAPWTEAQFRSKGVDALLAVAQQRPDLRLVFLWRGILEAEMRRRIEAAGLQDRVEVLNHQVDVNQVLAGVHATVVLAANEMLIKAYPHSLLESLAAGKPVMVSRIIPISQQVARDRCGVVVDQLTAESIAEAADQLVANYEDYCQGALHAGHSLFNQRQMVVAYKELYQNIVEGAI